MTRITVFGAGAIGGMIASRLERTGSPASLLVRPAQAAALREHGLRVRDGGEFTTRGRVSTDAGELGVQDVLFVCVKAHSLIAAAESLAPLIGPETIIVPAINGIPWWFFESFGGALQGRRLDAVDPAGSISRVLPASQCLGCVVYLAAHVEDGVVHCRPGQRLELGDPSSGSGLARVAPVKALLERAGFTVKTSEMIQREVWRKLWGNLPINPMSALTGCTVDVLARQPDTRELARAIMLEHEAIGRALGIELGMTVEERLREMAGLVGMRTSMLQDIEAGRPLEIDGIVAAVAEIGALAGIPTPFIRAVLGLVRQRAAAAGLYTMPAGANT